MKIGIVLASPPAYSETFFISKIKGLQKEGHQVILFVNNNQHYKFDLCKVQPQQKIGARSVLAIVLKLTVLMFTRYRTLYKFIVEEKKDNTSFIAIIKKVIICQHILQERDMDWLHFGFATLAIGKENIARAVDAKMAVSIRGFDRDVYPLKHKNCYKKLFIKVDKVHSISNYLLNKAYELGLCKKNKYSIITPAINLSEMKSGKDNKSSILKIVTIGRLHWIKNYSEILKALKLLKEKGYNFEYNIIGSGDLIEALKYEAYEYNLLDQVVFKGELSHSNTLGILSQSDIYIQYSFSEGFCNAVIEAQAIGKLCIVADAGALKENVLRHKTGWVVPKYNSNLLAQKLMDVIALSETEKNKIRENAMERVREKFNIEKQQKEFVDFYTKQTEI